MQASSGIPSVLDVSSVFPGSEGALGEILRTPSVGACGNLLVLMSDWPFGSRGSRGSVEVVHDVPWCCVSVGVLWMDESQVLQQLQLGLGSCATQSGWARLKESWCILGFMWQGLGSFRARGLQVACWGAGQGSGSL